MTASLDLALIGNCQIGALVDGQGELVWCCLPRFDGDPTFCSLLREHATGEGHGYCAVELVDQVAAEQAYLPHSAVLATRLTDARGGVIEISDFAPRLRQHGRVFLPTMLIRQLRRVEGTPRVIVRARPSFDYGRERCAITSGSHHVRYVSPEWTLRLTTDASITALLQETPFLIEDRLTLVFGPDETIPEAIEPLSRRFLAETLAYWHEWVRDLGIPFEWQDEVIRAAITLKPRKQAFTGTFAGEALDAGLLLMHDVGFLAVDDPRFASTVAAVERELRHGDYIFRYVEPDDFGVPRNAFVICTYWYIYALAALGRTEEARALFEHLLARRNRHGLHAEHLDVPSSEQWGNFVQTYSMVGLVSGAVRLSRRWDNAC